MNFREARENAGYSQKFVAITLGVQPPNVSRWEAGVTWPTVENLLKLADLYRVTTDYLLGREISGPVSLSPDELEVLRAFRAASGDTRRAAQAVLGVQAKEKTAQDVG